MRLSRLVRKTLSVLFALAGGLLIVTVVHGQEPRPVVFADSSERALKPGELVGLDCERLWVARSEILKRRGYCFRTKRGRAFFDNDDCWARLPKLSRLERSNIALIKKQERAKSCAKPMRVQ